MTVLLVLSLLGCSSSAQTTTAASSTSITPTTTVTPTTTTQHPSQFDGEKLTISIDGKSYTYIRRTYGTSSLTQDKLLSHYTKAIDNGTFVEGIMVFIYSTVEYPDYSYVLLITNGNNSWTYQLIEKQ